MVTSLQDQLKKSGLVDEKKAKQLKRAKIKEEKAARQSKSSAPEDRKRELQRLKTEQIEKDKRLNQEKNAIAERNSINAQIRQLIETNSIAQNGDKKYSFKDANKIKHIWVKEQQIDQLSQGSIAIVRHSEKFVLVPAIVAEKIGQRDSNAVVFRAEKNTSLVEDDPYADYKIPDDLDW